MNKRQLSLIIAIMAIAGSIISFAIAQPAGAGLSLTNSTRGVAPTTSSNLTTQGGNVSNADVDGWEITEKWAGYYGDITSEIVLEDADGNKFYNWSEANPSGGEILATRYSGTVGWNNLECANSTHIATEASELGLTNGGDNITNTFCEACGNYTTFTISSNTFNADVCQYRTNVFNSTDQTENWDQIILYDNSTNSTIYTTIIQQDTTGFNGVNTDFQLLVAENSTTDSLTTYYFYVEI